MIAPFSSPRPLGRLLVTVVLGGMLPASSLWGSTEWRFEPDATFDGAPALEGRTWIAEERSYAIRLTPLDDETRQRYLLHFAPGAADPFASPPDRRPRFLSYLLEIENRGDAALVFNAPGSWLTTNRREVQTPVGLPGLSFLYRSADRDMPPSYAKVGALLLDAVRVLAPGESIHGMLVYRNVAPKTKRFRVDVHLTLADGKTVRFAAPYYRPKVRS